MPEGPSIVILRELAEGFSGKKIVAAEGNAKIDIPRLVGQKIHSIRSWGKHFLVELSGFSVRVHFLMFGSYRIDERKDVAPRLSLQCEGGREINFYACSVKFVEGLLNDTYDWRVDVMSDEWNPALALKKLRATFETLACDALLDQDIFRRRWKYHKKRSAVPDSRASVVNYRGTAAGKATRSRQAGASIQL